MKRSPNYTLTYLADTACLLPYGQLIADHKHGLQLNETGALIWNLLKNPIDMPSLVELVACEFEILANDLTQLREDVESFVSKLILLGMVSETPEPEEPVYCYLNIAGLTLKLCGPKEAFSKDFDLFKLPPEEETRAQSATDQTILVCEEEPPLRENGSYLLRDPQLCIYETKDSYTLVFPASDQLREATLHKDGRQVVFYCQPPYGDSLVYDLFHAIRLSFLYLAGRHSMYAIHSASVFYRNKAWLFSGPSGTGKSTHTNLWKKCLSTPVINGDLNLLALKDGKPVIHGIPWCGTSGIRDSQTYDLGGIVQLRQEPFNQLLPLSDGQLRLGVFHRLISPLWTEDMLQNAAAFVNRLSSKIFLGKLGCTISPEAVYTIKEAIDRQF